MYKMFDFVLTLSTRLGMMFSADYGGRIEYDPNKRRKNKGGRMKHIKRVIALILVMLTVIPCGMCFTFGVSAAKQHTLSEKGLALIKYYEGFYPYAYKDYSHYSIGYGSTCGPNDYPNGITEAEASRLLTERMGQYEKYLDKFLDTYSIKLNQNQYDALVSFTYNLGGGVWTRKGDFALRTILINGFSKYSSQQIKDAFGEFIHAGGQVLSGLVKRRSAEAELFLTEYREPHTLFDDVLDASWCFTAIKHVYEKRYFSGTSEKCFSPDASMTRAMAVTVLAKIAGADLSAYGKQVFNDVPAGMWYSAAVDWASKSGYVGGTGDGMFSPSKAITRQDLVVILYVYAKNNGLVRPVLSLGVTGFSDAAKVGAYAFEAMNWAIESGILCGNPDGALNPADSATRAQGAAVIKAFDLVI